MSFGIEFGDMPKHINVEDGTFMMLQAMETTVMDSYTEFTAEDMLIIRNLWFYRMFNKMENTNILLNGLTTNTEGIPELDLSIDAKQNTIMQSLESAAKETKRLLIDERSLVRLHFIDMELLILAKDIENEPTLPEALSMPSRPARQGQNIFPVFKHVPFKYKKHTAVARKAILDESFQGKYAEKNIIQIRRIESGVMMEAEWIGRDLKNNLKQGGMADNQLVQHYIDIFMISNSCKGFVDGGKRFICDLAVSTLMEFEKENWICTEQRVNQFKSLIKKFKPDMAKLIEIPIVYSSHFTVYSINMYISGGRLDIIDSRKYTKDYLFKTRAEYHSNVGPIMLKRIDELLNVAYPSHNCPEFAEKFKEAKFPRCPKQTENECAYSILRSIQWYNGDTIKCNQEGFSPSAIREEFNYKMIYGIENDLLDELPEELRAFRPTVKEKYIPD